MANACEMEHWAKPLFAIYLNKSAHSELSCLLKAITDHWFYLESLVDKGLNKKSQNPGQINAVRQTRTPCNYFYTPKLVDLLLKKLGKTDSKQKFYIDHEP